MLYFGMCVYVELWKLFVTKKMNDLESRAEKGDSAAANTLFNYIINEPCPIPLGQVKELRNKALKGDKDAEEKVEEYNNFCEKIIKWGGACSKSWKS